MATLTRPADWPCGCHGWGWRHHDGHCCVTDLHTKTTDAPHCHMDIVDYYTADQFARFSWWQRLRLRQRRAQAVTDAAHHHANTYRPQPRKENPT